MSLFKHENALKWHMKENLNPGRTYSEQKETEGSINLKLPNRSPRAFYQGFGFYNFKEPCELMP